LNLAKHYGNERLEAACRRALSIGAPTRKRICSILEAKLGQHPELFAASTADASASPTPAQHVNLRGADYFRSTATEGDSDSCSSNPPSIH